MKKSIALLLALLMMLSCLPVSLAGEGEPAAEAEELQEAAAGTEETENPPAEEPEEEPVKEPEEKPAEKPVEKPAEEPADQSADKPEEEPAKEPEDKPGDNPAVQPAGEPADKPAEKPAGESADKPGSGQADGEDAPSEEQPAFTKGYAFLADGTPLYAGADCREKLGTLSGETVVYVTGLDEEAGHVQLLVCIEGEALSAWAKPEGVTPLTEEQAAFQAAKEGDLEGREDIVLLNAVLVPADQAADGDAGADIPDGEQEQGSGEAPEGGLAEGEGGIPGEDGEEPEEEEDEEGEAQEEEPSLPDPETKPETVMTLPDPADADEAPGVEGNAPAGISPSVSYNSDLGCVQVDWTDSVNTSEQVWAYQVYRYDGAQWDLIAQIYPGNTYSVSGSSRSYLYNDYGISEGQPYWYALCIWDNNNEYTVSENHVVVPLAKPVLSKARQSDGYWKLSWTSSYGADQYEVFRKKKSASSWPSKAYKTVTGTSLKDSSVKAGDLYQYKVRPCMSGYKGPFSDVVVCRSNPEEPAVTKLTQDNSSVTVTWKKAEGATGYQVFYKLPGGKWKTAGVTNSGTKTTYKHKYKIDSSVSGKAVEYRVRAMGKLGKTRTYGFYSSAKKIWRLEAPKIKSLKKKTEEDRISVSWDKVKGAKEYIVHYKVSGDSAYQTKTVTGTSATLPAVGTKTNEVRVTAVRGDSRSAKSSTKKITPYWYRVLLIGEYDYWDANKDLPASQYDVKGLGTLFGKQTGKVYRKYNLTASGIRSAISSAFGDASSNTVCVFMFSGHGDPYYDEYTTGSICCSDGSYITPASLKYYMDANVPSDHVVILLASCGSGAFIQPNGTDQGSSGDQNAAFVSAFVSAFSQSGVAANAAEFKGSRKYTVIAAAQAHQNGHGYTYKYYPAGCTYIMRYLARAGGYDYCTDTAGKKWIGKQGDKNGDKKISVYEAYAYAKPYVKKYGSSVMAFYSSEKDMILFP